MEKRKRKKKELFKTEIEDAVPSCFRCLRIFAGTGSDDRGSGDFPWTYLLISWRHPTKKKRKKDNSTWEKKKKKKELFKTEIEIKI